MVQPANLTVLCLASYYKGTEFLRECKRQGCRVLLLTSQSLEKEEWPRESIDEIFYLPDQDRKWNLQDAILGVSDLAKKESIDRIVPLDDFDLETAAALREHLRVGGMGETTTRYFRDKLAMRAKAQDEDLPVPPFIHVLNQEKLRDFVHGISPPWVLKPRSQAGAIGIKKITSAEELWQAIDKLGDQQSFYLLEQYVPGDIYHVDSIIYERKLLFSIASRYGTPPMDVSHGGGVFTTRTIPPGSPEEKELTELNERVLEAFNLVRGVSHSEFIRAWDGGRLYFLETSARVGGAHIAELVEAATGINLWAEWAKIEVVAGKNPYHVPVAKKDSAGLVISLARQQWPDTSEYCDSEIVWRMNKEHHAGLIVKSSSPERVQALVEGYSRRFQQDFMAYHPPQEKPTH